MAHLCQEEVLQWVVQPTPDDDKVWEDEPVPAPEGILSAPPNCNISGSMVDTSVQFQAAAEACANALLARRLKPPLQNNI